MTFSLPSPSSLLKLPNVFDCNLFLLFSHVASSPEWNPGLMALTVLFCLFTYFVFLILCAEVNDRDYRAWYGLGQTYEILKMPFYCLYYYRQAHKFRYAQFSLHSSTLPVYLTACVPHFGVFCDLLLGSLRSDDGNVNDNATNQ